MSLLPFDSPAIAVALSLTRTRHRLLCRDSRFARLLVAHILGALVCGLLGPATAYANRPPSSYEQNALDRSLEELDLSIDPDPEGKTVRHIVVRNRDVWSRDTGFMTIWNLVHITTRERTIERLVLLRPGELWNPERIEESRRKILNPVYTALVVIVPIRTDESDTIDLLVVTRDIQSLRMNIFYEFQESKFTQFSMSLSENNLLGRRKQIALIYELDQGSHSVSPLYIDRSLFGSRVELATKAGVIFSREHGTREGSQSTTNLTYPLWSLRSQWGGGVSVSHFDAVLRNYQGFSLRTYDVPETVEVEQIPWTYRKRQWVVGSHLTYARGDRLKQRWSLLHDVVVVRPRVNDDFQGDESQRLAFERDVMPPAERTSLARLRYEFFRAEYLSYRDIDSYVLPEDYQVGPSLSIEAGPALEFLGSDDNFIHGRITGGWHLDLQRSGFVRAAAAISGRWRSEATTDVDAGLSLKMATPPLVGGLRVAAFLGSTHLIRDTRNRYVAIGGESGLRGYIVGAFLGQHRVRAHVEVRTASTRLWFFRAGGVLFWDGGHAADRLAELDFFQDVGVGARLLYPQLQVVLMRLDWAVATRGPTAGLPGRVTAGFETLF